MTDPLRTANSVQSLNPSVPKPITIAPVSMVGEQMTMLGTALSQPRPGMNQTQQNTQQYGFTSVDNVTVPYIMRGAVKYVSVKMVEKKLLCKFPKINMEDMNNVCPIYSYYISDSEAKLLTEVSKKYNGEGDVRMFSSTDLIVSLEDFETFYERAKQHFAMLNVPPIPPGRLGVAPHINMPGPPIHRLRDLKSNTMNIPLVSHDKTGNIPPQTLTNIPPSSLMNTIPSVGNPINIPSGPMKTAVPGVGNIPPKDPMKSLSALEKTQMSFGVKGGWLQINNTVVPYVLRSGVKYVPLSVIKYAAGLLTDVRINGYKLPVSQEEFEFLNTSCKTARVNFTFSIKTKLIKLEHVIRMSHSKVIIHELPLHDPFTHAEWSEDYCKDGSKNTPDTGKPVNVISQTGIHQMPPRNPFIHHLGTNPVQPKQPHLPSGLPQGKIPLSMVSRDMKIPSPGGQGISNGQGSSSSGSRPSSAQSRASVTPPSISGGAVIKSFQFEGKTVSCLLRDREKEPYALVEALVKLYFNHCSIVDFRAALQQVLHITVQELSEEEEAEFIRFYGLKVKSLRSKSAVSFKDFKRSHANLKVIFPKKPPAVPIASPSPQETLASSGDKDKKTDSKEQQQRTELKRKTEMAENNNNKESVSVNNSENLDKCSNSTSSSDLHSKRKQSAPSHNRKPKQPRRLEDTVAKLKMRKETPEPNN